jgi:hypothetical protein
LKSAILSPFDALLFFKVRTSLIPIFNLHHDPAEASRMQSSAKRKVNQNMNRLVNRGLFIERLSTAEYKASSGLKNLDPRNATVEVVQESAFSHWSIQERSAATLKT